MSSELSVVRYAWHGQNRAGQILFGVLYGADKNSIRVQLAQRGIVAQRINLQRTPLRRPVQAAEVTYFLQEFKTLYQAGIPLLRILDVLLEGQKKPAFRQVIQTLRLDIERGESLHGALRNHPQVFDELTCNLVEVGETAGRLTDVLHNIIYTQERRQQLGSHIKTALTYPMFVMSVALSVWIAVLTWVVPVFEGVYKNAGKQLPALTQFLLEASRMMRSQGWLLFFLLIFSGLFLSRWKNIFWQRWIDHAKLRVPVFGHLLKTAWHAQFARTLGLLYQSGVPLNQALQVTARTISYRPMQDAIMHCTQDVLNGHSLSLAMATHSIFEVNLIQRVQIGEESGTLTDMLTQHAAHNEFLVEQTIKRLSSLIEPILILVIGAMVAVMLIALYLPILNLGSAIQ